MISGYINRGRIHRKKEGMGKLFGFAQTVAADSVYILYYRGRQAKLNKPGHKLQFRAPGKDLKEREWST